MLDILRLIMYSIFCSKEHGSLVKRSRRRPLTAKTGVRFPYELLTVNENLTAQPKKRCSERLRFGYFFYQNCSQIIESKLLHACM